MAASALWLKGALNFTASAPRSVAGKWRITLGSDSPITGDCLLVALDWVGNSHFGHGALRRGNATPAFQRLAGAAGADSSGYNVLLGLLTPDRISKHITESGVPLDDEQYAVLEAMSHAPDPVFCISALAGAGKTADAHCPESTRGGARPLLPTAPCHIHSANEGLAGGGGNGALQVQGCSCRVCVQVALRACQ